MRNKLNEQNERIQDIQNAYYEVITTNYNSWLLNMTYLTNINLINKNGENTNLFDILTGDKVVFYFDSKMCDVCVEKELDNLKEMGKEIGFEHIIVIGSSISPHFFTREEFIPFSQNMWRCSKNIYDRTISEEVPIISLMDNTNIVIGYYAPKVTNDVSKMFMKVVSKKYQK